MTTTLVPKPSEYATAQQLTEYGALLAIMQAHGYVDPIARVAQKQYEARWLPPTGRATEPR